VTIRPTSLKIKLKNLNEMKILRVIFIEGSSQNAWGVWLKYMNVGHQNTKTGYPTRQFFFDALSN
jgi:hypothetical protein